jgi:hypothetical protein
MPTSHMELKHLVRVALFSVALLSAVAVSGCLSEASVSYSPPDSKTPSGGEFIDLSLDGKELGRYGVGEQISLDASAGAHTVTVYDAATGEQITQKTVEIKDFSTQYWNLWE